MSVLVVGLSHKSAPVPVLERAALSAEALPKLLQDLHHTSDVAGTFVISTCNRVEIYADVDRFHGSVAAICELLSQYSGIPTQDLTGNLYVHYEERAVKHLLNVASGLDSMVVGEGQILGQVRTALNAAREHGTLGRALGEVGSAALRAGKRAHAETGIDRAGASLVSVGIETAVAALGRPSLTGQRVLVVGAGSMSSLAATTASRAGASRVTVANRTRGHADRLAAAVGGDTADLAELPRRDRRRRPGHLLHRRVRPGHHGGPGCGARPLPGVTPLPSATRPRLVFLDLAMPRDVGVDVAELPGVIVIGMDELADAGRTAIAVPGITADVAAVHAIVDEEFDGYRSAAHAAQVTPTVVALRAKAAEVVDAELVRLAGPAAER